MDDAPAPPAPQTRRPGSLLDVWTLWLAAGYAALLLLAALAVAFGWVGLEEALDLRRVFR